MNQKYNNIAKILNIADCPYGYNLNKEENRFIVNIDEYKIVQRIFLLRYKGSSLREIAIELNSDNIKSSKTLWSAQSVNRMLKNIQYIGNSLENNSMIKNTHKAIISKELFSIINGNNYS